MGFLEGDGVHGSLRLSQSGWLCEYSTEEELRRAIESQTLSKIQDKTDTTRLGGSLESCIFVT